MEIHTHRYTEQAELYDYICIVIASVVDRGDESVNGVLRTYTLMHNYGVDRSNDVQMIPASFSFWILLMKCMQIPGFSPYRSISPSRRKRYKPRPV